MIRSQTVHDIYRGETVVCGIFNHFLNFDNYQPEVISHAISGVVDQDVGIDVCRGVAKGWGFTGSTPPPPEILQKFFGLT